MSRQEFINPHGVFVLATLPDFLLTSKDLTFGAKLTYSVLCSLSGPDGSCSLPQAFLTGSNLNHGNTRNFGLVFNELSNFIRDVT